MSTDTTRSNEDSSGVSIAVIGIGCRFPDASDPFEFWRHLADGVELVERSAASAGAGAFHPAGAAHVAAASVVRDVDRFEWDFFGYSRQEAESIDPQQRVFLMCAWEAVEMAGYRPGAIPGRVGVIGSCKLSTYGLVRREDVQSIASPRTFQKLMGNDKDYLATRVSYKLGLSGPSYTVQTACSSSLVAVHLACEQIASGECDMVLAGGVGIAFPQEGGYVFQEGMIFSPDGRCRPFDADARGTLPGNGAAVVLLKALDRALEDGDPIFAVVRGSAVNNDGRGKAGFTAPSVDGQVEVITQALALAGVDPATIQLVEAHGTATPLGDPIEVEALTRAYRARTPRTQYCALGSVKSNLGHLDTAAGIASFVKAVMALHHAQIPPSLHFRSPNPAIAFEQTPYYVPQALQPWPEADHPRRAAVSAFGIGGTNAHAVLEQAPERDPGAAEAGKGGAHVLLLAARSPSALAVLAGRHAERLVGVHGGEALRAYCATSLHHRTPFRCRLVLVAATRSELVEQLRAFHETGPKGAATLPARAVDEGVTLWVSMAPASARDPLAEFALAEAGKTHPDFASRIPAPSRRASIPTSPFEGERCWASDAGLGEEAPSTEPWDAARREGEASAVALAASLDLGHLPAEVAGIDALHAIYVSRAFEELGAFAPAEDAAPSGEDPWRTVDECMARGAVPRRYRDLVARLLRDSVATGVLRARDACDEPRYGDFRPRPLAEAANWLAQMRAMGYERLAALVERAGPKLGAMLTGRVDPVGVIFPAAATTDVEHMYQEQPYSVYLNAVLARVAAAMARSGGRPLRILEVGAGTGGTTRDVLASLPQGACETYTFTDVGPLFLERAREKFAQYAFVEYATLDIEQMPTPFRRGHYDLIIAANVLHNARALRKTLRELGASLRAGGCLLVREVTEPKRLFDFVFGPLVPPIEDGDRRGGELFASVPSWQSALADAGFTRSASFPDAQAEASKIGEHVLFAKWGEGGDDASPHRLRRGGTVVSIDAASVAPDGASRYTPAQILRAAIACLPDAERVALDEVTFHADPSGLPAPLPLEVAVSGTSVSAEIRTADDAPFSIFTAALHRPRVLRETSAVRRARDMSDAWPASVYAPWREGGALYRWTWSERTSGRSRNDELRAKPVRRIVWIGETDTQDAAEISAAFTARGIEAHAYSPFALAGDPAAFERWLRGRGPVDLVCYAPSLPKLSAASEDAAEPHVQAQWELLAPLLGALPHLAPPSRLAIVMPHARRVVPGDAVTGWAFAGVSALVNVVRSEHSAMAVMAFDPGEAKGAALVEHLLDALTLEEPWVAIRANAPFVSRLEVVAPSAVRPIPEGRHILIGGLSPLGLEVAGWLADRGARELLVLARRLPDAGESSALERLRARGVRVTVDAKVDVTSPASLNAALDRCAQDGTAIGCLVHLAGVVHDAPLAEAKKEPWLDAIRTKLLPALTLHAWEARLRPASTLYFSSAATVFGPAGQGAHAVANALLERLAEHRCDAGMDTVALAWGFWAATRGESVRGRLEARGMNAMSSAAALGLLWRALSAQDACYAAMDVDWNKVRGGKAAGATTSSAVEAPLDFGQDPEARPVRAREYLRVRVATLLRCEERTVTDGASLVQLGLDSLMFLDLNERIARELGVRLSAEAAFRTGTLESLAEVLVRELDGCRGAVQRGFSAALAELHGASADWLEANGDVTRKGAAWEKAFPLLGLPRARFVHRGPGTGRYLYVEYDKASLDVNAFERAWNAVVDRHPMLRSRIDDDAVVHVAPPGVSHPIARLDWRALPPDERAARAVTFRAAMERRTFDLRCEAPFELAVTQTDDGFVRLHLGIDTTLIDIESFRIILREIHALVCEPDRDLPPLAFSAADYFATQAALRSTRVHAEQWAAYGSALAAMPPPPNLPLQCRRDEITEPRFDIFRHALPRDRWLTVKARAEQEGLTGTAVLLAAFGLALGVWAKAPRFSLRLDYTDRQPLHAQAVNVVLDASACAVVPVDLESARSFVALARACGETVRARLEHDLVDSAEVLDVYSGHALGAGHPAAGLPIAFTSLLGVRETYAIPETSDPLLGMPSHEYASSPSTWLHVQALEEESALLFNVDAIHGLFPEDFAEAILLTLGSFLEALAHAPDAWLVPLAELAPPDAEVLALAASSPHHLLDVVPSDRGRAQDMRDMRDVRDMKEEAHA